MYIGIKNAIVGCHNQDVRGCAAECTPQMPQVLKNSSKLLHEYNYKINVIEEILATSYLIILGPTSAMHVAVYNSSFN